MGKKSELSAEQRVQLVLRLLSKEEPAAQSARRAGIADRRCTAGAMSSSTLASARSMAAG
jgi:hypothetical protein